MPRQVHLSFKFNMNHLFSYARKHGVILMSVALLCACVSMNPETPKEQKDQILVAKESNLDHHVPTTLEEATKNPGNLGVYSPLGTSTSMTSNNTGLQTTQNTPTLATPFIALQNVPTDTSSKNGIPANIAKLMKDKKWDEALKAIDVESKKSPRNVQILFVRTRILIEQGQLESARQALLAFIDKYPEIPEPYNNLAVLYARAGRLDLARDNLEMCIKLSPNYAIGLQNLGDIYTLIAASYYDQAFKQNSRMTEADQKRKLAEAITSGLPTNQNTPTLAKPFMALQNAPTDTSSKNGIPATIVKLMKDKIWDEALKAIDVESKKSPGNVQILFARTRILIEQGQVETARQALVTFIDKYPETPEPYNNLAVLYARAGKLDLARDNLEMCIKLSPKYAIGLQNLGDIYTLIAASYYDQAFKQNRRMTEADKKRKLAEAITSQ